MRLRGPERSSILLLGKSTVIIGAIVITVLSFGLGYFWGYKGSDVSQTEDEVKKDAAQKVIIPPEDKRVLETTSTTPKEAPIAPSIKPPEFPQETTPQKSAEPEVEDRSQKTENRSQKTENTGQNIEGRQDLDTSQPTPKVKGKAKSNSLTKPSNRAVKTGDSTASKKLYAIQFGAFPNKEGAEQLRQSLISKGIKAYIVRRTESDPYFRVRVGTYKTKREADLAAVSLQKKTGMQNFVTLK
jgi:cell division protein FtsN